VSVSRPANWGSTSTVCATPWPSGTEVFPRRGRFPRAGCRPRGACRQRWAPQVTVPAKNSLKTCLPPDPNPVKPALVLPPGACDATATFSGPPPNFPMRPTEATRRPTRPSRICRSCMLTWEFPVPSSCMPAATGRKWMSPWTAIASSNGAYRGVRLRGRFGH